MKVFQNCWCARMMEYTERDIAISLNNICDCMISSQGNESVSELLEVIEKLKDQFHFNEDDQRVTTV